MSKSILQLDIILSGFNIIILFFDDLFAIIYQQLLPDLFVDDIPFDGDLSLLMIDPAHGKSSFTPLLYFLRPAIRRTPILLKRY